MTTIMPGMIRRASLKQNPKIAEISAPSLSYGPPPSFPITSTEKTGKSNEVFPDIVVEPRRVKTSSAEHKLDFNSRFLINENMNNSKKKNYMHLVSSDEDLNESLIIKKNQDFDIKKTRSSKRSRDKSVDSNLSKLDASNPIFKTKVEDSASSYTSYTTQGSLELQEEDIFTSSSIIQSRMAKVEDDEIISTGDDISINSKNVKLNLEPDISKDIRRDSSFTSQTSLKEAQNSHVKSGLFTRILRAIRDSKT